MMNETLKHALVAGTVLFTVPSYGMFHNVCRITSKVKTSFSNPHVRNFSLNKNRQDTKIPTIKPKTQKNIPPQPTMKELKKEFLKMVELIAKGLPMEEFYEKIESSILYNKDDKDLIETMEQDKAERIMDKELNMLIESIEKNVFLEETYNNLKSSPGWKKVNKDLIKTIEQCREKILQDNNKNHKK